MIELSQADLIQFNKDVEHLIKSISDADKIKKILSPAAFVVKERARQLTPKANIRNRDNSIERKFPPKKLRSDVTYILIRLLKWWEIRKLVKVMDELAESTE